MRVLRKSGLYRFAQHHGLMDMTPTTSLEGIPPYLLGDKGYVLLSWILTPHKDDEAPLSVFKLLYNKRDR
jgi:hypothetical protein